MCFFQKVEPLQSINRKKKFFSKEFLPDIITETLESV